MYTPRGLSKETRRTAMMLAVMLGLASLVVGLAPPERTLGTGIRAVYVHVALTLTGMLGFAISGLLGGVALLTAHRGSHAWMLATGRIALLFHAAGLAVSMAAAWINWGGVFLGEPLLRSSLMVLAAGVLSHSAIPLVPPVRPRAALAMLPFAVLLGTTVGTPFLMHPGGPVLATSPRPILLTFAGLTLLSLLTAALASYALRRRLDA